MNTFIKDMVVRKLQESSTWAGIVTAVCGAIGWNAPPDVQAQLVAIALPVVSLALVLINERKGPNPKNAPVSEPVARDVADAVGVQLPASPPASASAHVQTEPVATVRPATAAPDKRERPGFTNYDP